MVHVSSDKLDRNKSGEESPASLRNVERDFRDAGLRRKRPVAYSNVGLVPCRTLTNE